MSPSRASIDSNLLLLAQSGDREAFAALYGHYWARAVRTATIVGGTSDAANDVVRVAFGEAWETRSLYRSDSGSVHSWLFGLVRQVAADTREGGDLWGRTRFSDQVPAENESDVGAETVDAIAALLDGAPSDQRETIALAFFGELSPAEIATHLHLSEETVEGRIRFGLAELRGRDFTSRDVGDGES